MIPEISVNSFIQNIELPPSLTQREAYRTVVDSTLQGLAIIQNNQIVFANSAMADISGYSVTELTTFSAEQVKDLVCGDDQDSYQQYLDDCLAEKLEDPHLEFKINRAGNEPRWVETYVSLVEFRGNPAIQIAYIDIQERKEAEAERERLYQEVKQQRAELRNLTERLAKTQEIERQQLAHELHDQMGQKLTALSFNINFVRTRIPDNVPNAAAIDARLDDSQLLVEQMTGDVRDITANLIPPVLDNYGLVDALEWYADQHEVRLNMKITVKGQPIHPRLSPTIERTLFRIAQEALTNAARHAEADEVNIIIETTAQSVQMIITDNGRGFNLQALDKLQGRKGLGLKIMLDRARTIGGRFDVDSTAGRGTKIIVEVPRAL